MLTGAQHGLYKRLFDAVLAVQPGADRLAMHEELGLPESRKDWTNAHFDEWKRACLAISQPGNLDAQMDDGDVKRRLFVVRELLGKMTAVESYAEKIVRHMGYEPPLELLSPKKLEALIVALRKQIRRDRKNGIIYSDGGTQPEGDPF